MIRKIFGLGKASVVVSLPKEIIKKLGWRKGQRVKVERNRRKIEIKDA